MHTTVFVTVSRRITNDPALVQFTIDRIMGVAMNPNCWCEFAAHQIVGMRSETTVDVGTETWMTQLIRWHVMGNDDSLTVERSFQQLAEHSLLRLVQCLHVRHCESLVAKFDHAEVIQALADIGVLSECRPAVAPQRGVDKAQAIELEETDAGSGILDLAVEVWAVDGLEHLLREGVYLMAVVLVVTRDVDDLDEPVFQPAEEGNQLLGFGADVAGENKDAL